MGMNAAQTRPFPSPGAFGTSTTQAVTKATAPTGGVVTAGKYVPPPINSSFGSTPFGAGSRPAPAAPGMKPITKANPFTGQSYYGDSSRGATLGRLSGRDWLSFANANI